VACNCNCTRPTLVWFRRTSSHVVMRARTNTGSLIRVELHGRHFILSAASRFMAKIRRSSTMALPSSPSRARQQLAKRAACRRPRLDPASIARTAAGDESITADNIRRARPTDVPAVSALLQDAGLPTADLKSVQGLQMWVLEAKDSVLGGIALEPGLRSKSWDEFAAPNAPYLSG
jgi:hypothetical protein